MGGVGVGRRGTGRMKYERARGAEGKMKKSNQIEKQISFQLVTIESQFRLYSFGQLLPTRQKFSFRRVNASTASSPSLPVLPRPDLPSSRFYSQLILSAFITVVSRTVSITLRSRDPRNKNVERAGWKFMGISERVIQRGRYWTS